MSAMTEETRLMREFLTVWLADRPLITGELQRVARAAGLDWTRVYPVLRQLEHRGDIRGHRLPRSPVLWSTS